MIAHAVRANSLVVVCPPALRADLLAELGVAVPADLGQPTAGPELVAWLARQTWLLRERGSGTRATTEVFFEELDIAPGTLTVGSNVAVCESVAAGLGVTLISRDAVARELGWGVLAELPCPGTPLRRDWCLVSRAGRLPAPSQLFIQQVWRSEGWTAAR